VGLGKWFDTLKIDRSIVLGDGRLVFQMMGLTQNQAYHITWKDFYVMWTAIMDANEEVMGKPLI
jgi:hypothetical protein